MIRRQRSTLSGLAALAVLLILVIGMPVVLYRFGGSPLPRSITGWRRIIAILASRDDGTVLLSIIRVCSWLAWLLFTTCVVAEVQAALRGRRAPRLRLGGVQGAAAQLVALSTLAFAAPSAFAMSPAFASASELVAWSGANHQPGTSSQSVEPISLIASQLPPYPEAARQLSLSASQPAGLAVDAVKASRLVTVRPGDCLWSLAQRYLGAGDMYPEIVRLNYERPMANGQIFTSPSLIEVGWQLLMPVGATVRTEEPVPSSHHLGHPTADPHYRRRHPAAPGHAAEVPPVHQRQAPRAAPPEAAATAGSAGPSNRRVGDSIDSIDNAVGQSVYRTPPSSDPAGAYLPDGAAFLAGALAGAALCSLTRLRQRQRQERRRGRRISLPAEPDALAAEQRFRAFARVEPVETLHDALAGLEASLLSGGQELPDIIGLHITPDALQVLLATPAVAAPPAPFTITPGRQGMCWELQLPATMSVPGLEHTHSDGGLVGLRCHMLPGLITAGATSSGYMLLDLESMQVAACDGPRDLVDQAVVTMATELATGQWSGCYDLMLVGCDELADVGWAEHCPSVGAAIDLLSARRGLVAHRLAERAPGTVRGLRLTEPENEDWGLTIFVSRVEPTPAEMARLLQIAEDGPGGIAALVAGDPETGDGRMAPTVIQLAPDPERSGGIVANIVPLQITVRPRALSNAEYEAIGSLLAAAADLDDVGQDEEPYIGYDGPPWIQRTPSFGAQFSADESGVDDGVASDSLSREHARAPERVEELEDEAVPDDVWAAQRTMTERVDWVSDDAWLQPNDWQPNHGSAPDEGSALRAGSIPQPSQLAGRATSSLDVKILGPFAVSGTVAQLQPKQAELVLALTLAVPAGLSNSALCAILGADPDHPKPGDAVRQIITRTRRRLGLASDGQQYIIHAGNGQYVMHPDASLDWSRFRELVASGRADDLRAALSLINGQPFAGSYFWWIDIPLIETVRAEIVDAAEMLAEFELTIGSPRAAAKAARAGLLAEPSAEQLWRAVMRAEHAAGSLAGVGEAWRHCLDAIEDIAPGGEPHPDTAMLYRQLTAGARHEVQVP